VVKHKKNKSAGCLLSAVPKFMLLSFCSRYGDHYWIMDVDMDCTATEAGWFELKAYLIESDGSESWESNIAQSSSCNGDIGGSKPYTSGNHFARCGYINVFEHGKGDCTIKSFYS